MLEAIWSFEFHSECLGLSFSLIKQLLLMKQKGLRIVHIVNCKSLGLQAGCRVKGSKFCIWSRV